MTEKQKEDFNRMLHYLRRISKEYQTPSKLRKDSEKDWDLGYEETLEMAYENIQNDAKFACKGIKEIK